MQEYLTPNEVAAALKVTPRTIYEWVRSGKLPARRLGPSAGRWRILPSDVDRFMAAGAVNDTYTADAATAALSEHRNNGAVTKPVAYAGDPAPAPASAPAPAPALSRAQHRQQQRKRR